MFLSFMFSEMSLQKARMPIVDCELRLNEDSTPAEIARIFIFVRCSMPNLNSDNESQRTRLEGYNWCMQSFECTSCGCKFTISSELENL